MHINANGGRGAVSAPRPGRGRGNPAPTLFAVLFGFALSVIPAAAQAVDWHSLPPGPPTAPRLDGPTFWRENLAKHAKDRASWEARAAWIRRQILVGAGLWPMPERTPLNAEVYGRIERDGYAIEKVRFQKIGRAHV